ncbi:MAG: SUMF1/EgtB/PvdO family nonheme iron enzyme [Bacteroidia bacterium]|nr:SUMF1/EgtB/PvdO family nonheme iron enzyme [Bacteroidia bacterium]
MKQKLFSVLTALILGCSFLVAQTIAKAPKDSRLVPMGTFYMDYINGQDTVRKQVSVNSFYLTNEVNNKEYREFITYLKANPADTLFCFDLSRLKEASRYWRDKKSKDSTFKRTVSDKWMEAAKPFVLFKTNTELLKDIIDTNVWQGVFANDKKLQQKYDHYFSDKEFNDYPVVGVNYENARWFCVWKSKTDYEQRISQGKPIENDFRLPSEVEWMYAASQGKTKSAENNTIHSAKEGEKNALKIKNLSDNVCEWTTSNGEYQFSHDLNPDTESNNSPNKIVKGGSWKTGQGIGERKLCDKNARNCYTGFRMVKTLTVYPAKKV